MTKKLNLGNGQQIYCQFYSGDDVPSELSSSFSNVKRARDYYNSRHALLLALKETIPLPAPLSFEQLEIIDHRILAAFPQTKVSLSHTGPLAVAAASTAENILSLGIDIEKVDRQIKVGVEHYIAHPHDDHFESLKLWVIKEACFKAIAPLVDKHRHTPLVLKDIWVKQGYFGLDLELDIVGYFQIDIEQYNENQLFLAVAWVFQT